MNSFSPFGKQRRIVAYLDGLNERVNVLRRLQSESQAELPPPFHFGDATQDALLPSVLDRASKAKGETI